MADPPSPGADPPVMHLQPGELIFGRGRGTIQTLLGSCVAVTLWHPQRRLSGMCHFVLPARPGPTDQPPDARYGRDCLQLFKQLSDRHGVRLGEFEACLFGGGNLLNRHRRRVPGAFAQVNRQPVGEANVAEAWALLRDAGIRLVEADVGEFGYRRVHFDTQTGQVDATFVAI